MLHAIYIYLRVFEKSTHPITPNSATLVEPELAENSLCRYPLVWRDFKHQDVSYPNNDIMSFETKILHLPSELEEPSMFEQIYSIPESLFRLLSQTTYLGNEVSRARYNSTIDPQLSLRIKGLGEQITRYKNPYVLMAQAQTRKAGYPASEEDREVQRRMGFYMTS
jgi:arginine metabolism regulation protein II